MKLERIILENFRQYYGKQRLEFSTDPIHNITVVEGVNGAGKTSLFLAINWCLYGEEAFKRIIFRGVDKIRDREKVGELINSRIVDETPHNQPLQASVELTFTNLGRRYIAKRSITAHPILNMEGVTRQSITDDFSIREIRPDGETRNVPAPEQQVNTILPANVRPYFFFDGEKINDFAKPEAADEVKEAIYLIIRLEVLDRARTHLKDATRDYNREIKQVSDNEALNQLLDQQSQCEAEIIKNEGRKKELKKEITLAESQIADIDQRLREMQGIKDLQTERDRVRGELGYVAVDIDACTEKIRSLSTEGYFVFAAPAIEQAVALLEEKRAKGEIPSNIRQQFVHDLLDSLTCICGRHFEEHGEEYKRLVRLLQSSVPGSIEDEILDISGKLRGFNNSIARRIHDINTEMQTHTQLQQIQENLLAKESEISFKLQGEHGEDVRKLELKRQDYLASMNSSSFELGQVDEKLRNLNDQLEDLEKRITKAEKLDDRVAFLSKKREVAIRSAQAIDEQYQRFADNMRLQIEERTNEIFGDLSWKGEHFQRVTLNEEYHLEVYDRYDRPVRAELSAGERQVLSLAFITAIGQVSDSDAPLVMDTPFGRLSSEHRANCTLYLPKLCDQLVLFVTDEELGGNSIMNLRPRIGYQYELRFDEHTSCTEILKN